MNEITVDYRLQRPSHLYICYLLVFHSLDKVLIISKFKHDLIHNKRHVVITFCLAKYVRFSEFQLMLLLIRTILELRPP